MDRLAGLLAEADFERIYQRVKMDRTSLEEKLKELESQKKARSAQKTEQESWCSSFWILPTPAGSFWSASSSVWN